MKAIMSWIRKAITLIGAVIIVLLIADFNQQLIELSRLKEQLNTDEALLTELVENRDNLLVLKDYAASDKAVEDFARQEGYMAKSGDIVYVVLPDSDSPESDSRKSYSEFNDDKSNLEKWFFWLFGN